MLAPSKLGFFPLFAKQSQEMLYQIANLAEEKVFEPGAQLFFEGEVAKSLFQIEEGSVELTMNMGGVTEKMEPLGKGEVIGWSSIVEPRVYKLGAQAKHKTRVLVFKAEQLRALFDENPSFGYHFMNALAEVIGARLISKCVQIMSLADKKPAVS